MTEKKTVACSIPLVRAIKLLPSRPRRGGLRGEGLFRSVTGGVCYMPYEEPRLPREPDPENGNELRDASLPEDATELAKIVQDEAQPQPRRDAAWSRLQKKVIEPRAKRIWRGRSDEDVFCGEAIEHVWDRLVNGKKFDPAKGSFQGWLSSLLQRFCCDFHRRQQRNRRRIQPWVDDEASPEAAHQATYEAEDLSELAMSRRVRLRHALDEIRAQYDNGGGSAEVDYYAVLLVQLRLVMVKCVDTEAGSVNHLNGTVADFIAWVLPWIEEEAMRSFRPGWPSLGSLWTNLAAFIDQPPYVIKVTRLCEVVNATVGGAPGLTPAVWNQWVRRAKQKARAIVGDSVWQDVFTALLPDAPVRGEPSGG